MRLPSRAGTTLGGILVALLAAAVYFDTARLLVEHWMTNDVYSYAFLVPFISGVLVWLKWNDLRQVGTKPALFWGIAVTSAGLAMLLVGRVSGTNVVQELSLIVTLAGLVLLLMGKRPLRILLFPLLYLLGMIPVWEFLTTRLHPIFQLYSASIGVGALKLLGYPVLREGVLIELPRVTLEVAEACSGINYLISVLCIGIPLTVLFIRGWTRRVGIIFVAVAIALLSNGARVAIVALFAYYDVRGPNGDIHGPYALFRSLLISGVGYSILFGLVFRFADKSPFPAPSRTGAPSVARPDPFVVRPLPVAIAIALLSACVAFGVLHRVEPVPLSARLRLLPPAIAGWQARPFGTFVSDLDGVEFDNRLTQNYLSPDGTELNVFLGYFQRQVQGRELAGYSLRTLFKHRDQTAYTVGNGTHVKDFLVTTRGGDTFYVSYWYALNGRSVTEDYAAKFYTAWDSVVRSRSNGGIVMVKMKSSPGEPLANSRQRASEIILALAGVSKSYFPE